MTGTARIDPHTGVLGTDGGDRVVVRRVLIRVATGPDRGAERLLDGGTLMIGSHPDSDLVLKDPTVSRSHAELALLPSGVRVKDLGSTNGTFVGESRIESVVLPAGSELRVGKTRLEILAADVPLPEPPSERTRLGRLVGASPPMRRLFAQLEKLGPARAPIWLVGEAGSGKSEAARALHDLSGRGRGPFVTVDLDPSTPASSLATGAQAAVGGTLVLDRLDEATAVQLDAVLALVDRLERDRLDVRIVVTSRVDPRVAVETGRMRRELFFQLAGARVVMPPLREHLEDLPELVDALAEELGYAGLRLGATDLAHLRAQAFPDNVRQLRRLIEETLLRRVSRPSRPPPPGGERTTEELSRLPFKEAKEQLLDAFEARYVAQLLERAGGNVSRAADEAGIDRNHLARLAKKHGLRG